MRWSVVLPLIAVLQLLVCGANSSVVRDTASSGWAPHGWSNLTDQLWVLFSGHDYRTMPTASQWEFVANHYAIVTLAACFASEAYPYTEDAAAEGVRILKGINPSQRVMYYQNSFLARMSCYRWGDTLEHEPSWWLRDDEGQPYTQNHRNDTRFYDLRQSVVRSFVASASTDLGNSTVKFDGVFADKATDVAMRGLTDEQWAEVVAGHHESLNLTRTTVRNDMAPGALVIANAVRAVNGATEPSEHGLEDLPFTDGVCFEHFMSFEMLDPATGWLDPARYRLAVQLVQDVTAQGKVTLVRGWPGPVTTPLGVLGPSYSRASGLTTPTTPQERAAAAARFVDSSLAGYLIVASELTYYSYNWWYEINDGVYPCPEDPSSCSAPGDWFPVLLNATGRPVSSASVRGDIWTREFEHVAVVFDASNVTASQLLWR